MFENETDDAWHNRLGSIPNPNDQEALDKASELVHTVLGQVSEKARIVLTLQELEGAIDQGNCRDHRLVDSLVKVQAFRARKENAGCRGTIPEPGGKIVTHA